jgi:hypothetical protein
MSQTQLKNTSPFQKHVKESGALLDQAKRHHRASCKGFDALEGQEGLITWDHVVGGVLGAGDPQLGIRPEKTLGKDIPDLRGGV